MKESTNTSTEKLIEELVDISNKQAHRYVTVGIIFGVLVTLIFTCVLGVILVSL